MRHRSDISFSVVLWSFELALLSAVIASGCTTAKQPVDKVAPPALVAPPLPPFYRSVQLVSANYPEASRRTGEQGRVVVQFDIDLTGRVSGPVDIDKKQSNDHPHLILAAQRLFHGAHFPVRRIYKRTITASILFEIAPCGTLAHAPGVDYTVNFCVEKFLPPPPAPQ
jgi:TonB family protein